MAYEPPEPVGFEDNLNVVQGQPQPPPPNFPQFTQDDLDYLHERGIPVALAAEAGLRGVTSEEATRLLGRTKSVGSAGLLIPYPGVTPPYFRIRFHDPDAAGARYLTLPGREVPLYTVDPAHKATGLTPAVPPALAGVLVVVESAMKALALTALGIDAVGLSGTATTLEEKHGARRLNGSWPRSAIAGRTITLLFDAGRANNPAVARDEARLARALSESRATVSVAALPLNQAGEDQGPDDYLATNGPAALFAVLTGAAPAAPVDRVQAQAAGHAADLLDDLPFMASIVEASAGVGAKAREALVNAGLAKADINKAVMETKQRASSAAPGKGPSLGDHLGVADGCISRILGSIPVPLCNFDARIVEEHVLDDGAVQDRTIKVAGSLKDGTPLPEISMKAEELTDSKWPLRHWGTKAIVAGVKLAGDDLRLAIQTLSSPVVQRTYAHTGWRKLTDATGAESGDPVFLHAGGALGGTGVSVRLEDQLAMYRLPDLIHDPVEAVRLSLELLHVAPQEVTVPLLGLTYRAPTQTALPADLSGLMVGKTGSLKTSIAKLAAAHFGKRLADRPVTTFQASVASIEMVLHSLKDVVAVADDFKPRNAMDPVHGKAHAVFSSIGDQEGRGRMDQNGAMRASRPPRALVIATGETPPSGESTVARLLLLQVDRNTVDLKKLSAAQGTAHRLPHAMAAYLQWLQPRMAGIESELRRKHTQLRARFEKVGAGGHLRSPSALAHVALGYEYLLPFAVDLGAIDAARARKISGEVFETLETLGKKGASTARDVDPVTRFLDFLRGLIEQGKVLLAEGRSEELGQRRGTEGPIGEHIGWMVDEHLYLLGEVAYTAVKRAMDQAGVDLPHGDRVLWRRLRDMKHVELGDRDDRLTVREMLGGKRREVIALKKVALWPPEGEDGPPGPGGGGSPPPPQSDDGDLGVDNRTSEPPDRTTTEPNRTSGSAGSAGGGGGRPPVSPALAPEFPVSDGPVGPVGPLRKEEKIEKRSVVEGEALPHVTSAGSRARPPLLRATGPTGPALQPPVRTQEAPGLSDSVPDQPDQQNREMVADGLAYLRQRPAAKGPLWCVKTGERLLGVVTAGTLGSRQKELEAKLAAAGLAKTAILEFDLLPVIAEMERAGLGVDAPAWSKLVKDAGGEMESAKAAMADLGLHEPEDADRIRAGLAARGLAVSSTAGKALAAHAGDPLVAELGLYRRSAGLYWSICRPLQQAIKGGRVRATFDPLGCATGRMTASKPNLLSIPKNPAYRQCIVPRPGHRLVVADYSAIELRILAAVTGDPALQQVFREGCDPHAATAARLFGNATDAVTKDERQAGKAVNFGFAYGMGPATFVEHAHDYGVELTVEQAHAHRAAFFAAYPGIAVWQGRVKRSAALEARSLGGRRILFKPDTTVPQRLNAPIQATGADGLKRAMVLLHDRLKPLGAHIVLAVHDELLVEVPEPRAEEARALVERTMVEAMSHFIPSVPVKVASSVRLSWADPDSN